MTTDSLVGERIRTVDPRSPARQRQADGGMAPEFLLTLACCRWPPTQARNAAICAAAAATADWQRFLRLVQRHRVAALAGNALRSAGLTPPAAVAARLASVADIMARKNLRLAAETFRLQGLFDAAGIPVLTLKGAALGKLAYGAIEAKQTRDIDLLVPPEQAEAAIELLEGEGYALSAPARHLTASQRRALVRHAREVELVHAAKRLLVELQWRVIDNPQLLQGVEARSAWQSVPIADGIALRTLRPDDLFAYLAVHGAHHAWSRIKWLADVNAMIANGNSDVVRLYRHAQRIGAGACAAQTLVLCRRLFDLPLPAALADELLASKRAGKLAAIAIDAMRAPQAETAADNGLLGVARVVRTQFLLGQGWAFHAAQYRAALTGAADVVRLPLPRGLHFLYPLLRLPMWLWRRAVMAVSAGGHNR